MSIEKDLGRIADALEKIVELSAHPLKEVVAKPAPVVDAAPGPLEDDSPRLPPDATTGAELRTLAQAYIQAAGDKTNLLVTFIKDKVCKKLAPANEPKLVKIPDDKVPEAAKMIREWATKNGVQLPIEV